MCVYLYTTVTTLKVMPLSNTKLLSLKVVLNRNKFQRLVVLKKNNGNYKLSMCFFLINTYVERWTILHFCNIIDHTNHKLHGPWFDNNSYAKSTFQRFMWNKYEYRSSICIFWTLMWFTLFNPKCHMPICIVYTWMLYVFSCWLHEIVHTTSMFK
jgi:hypothetical protein